MQSAASRCGWITGSKPGEDGVKMTERVFGNLSLKSWCDAPIFLADMETHTPNPAKRLTILMEELGPAPGAGPLRVLVWDLLTCLMRLFASLAERGPQQQVFRNDTGVEPGRPHLGHSGASGGAAAAAGDAGADRRGAAGRPDAQGRVAVSAAVAAADGTRVIDGATQEDCIGHEASVAAACGRWPGERRPDERRHRAAIARAVAALEYGSRVLAARFAKMGLIGWVELCRFRYDLAMITDCCRG
jgi:hypothetical protein